MSKLDFELLQQAPSFLNAVRDRELDLRGNKFQRIENLILTKDQHDTLNVTDNDLRILDNFPYMPRLKNIMAAYNRITKLSSEL
jgi:U2 small nuclear ribonucleoprotein A'